MTPNTSHLVTLFLVVCAMAAVLPHPAAAGRVRQQATCAVGTSSISLQEEFVDEDGGSPIYCRGSTTIRQCEGTCFSQSIPSIAEPTGYSKVCNCCKEESLEAKEVILTDCYDAAGNALAGQRYPVQVPEPESCRCQRCSL